MSLRKPDPGSLKNPDALLTILVGFYDALQESRRSFVPSRVPVLKHGTASTHAELRGFVGHIDGESAPRVCIVAGTTTPLDGGEGAYIWDPDSTLADNATTVIQPMGIAKGRWRKATL